MGVVVTLCLLLSLFSLAYSSLWDLIVPKEHQDKAGLHKLTEREKNTLAGWVMLFALSLSERDKFETVKECINKFGGDVEEAVVLKASYLEDYVIVRRENGEVWLLESKSSCSWVENYEGKKVLLDFGYTSSTIYNLDLDECSFYTEKELD